MIGLVLIYLTAAFVGAMWPRGPATAEPRTEVIGLVRGPIHYDILLPLADHPFAFLAKTDLPLDHPLAKWVMVGWGAREFYTTVGGYSDVTMSAVARGVLGDASVVRFDVVGDLGPSASVQFIQVTPVQRRGIEARILAELKGVDPLDHPGLTATDVFFPARSRFHLFRTCNAWVGAVLRGAGLRFGAWTPLPFSVTLALKRFDHI